METIKSNIRLGTSTNLVNGYDPSWTPGNPLTQGLFPTTAAPLTGEDITIAPGNAAWALPVISIHDDADALLDALFPFTVSNPSDGVKEFEAGAGSLLLGGGGNATLENTLGVPLGSGYGYALLSITRVSGQALHPVSASGIHVYPNPATPDPALGVNDDFRKDLAKVRPSLGSNGHFDPQVLTAAQAQSCIDLYNNWGTHFVSKVTVGDRIFQVFCYTTDRYTDMKTAFLKNDFSGYGAVNFAYYTADANTGTTGYVTRVGHILNMSGDPAIAQSIGKGDWKDAQWSGSDSILAPILGKGNITMDTVNTFVALTPIAFELTTLSIFAEFERRRCMRRVLKGAMIQQFGNAVRPHFETYCPYVPAAIIPNGDIAGPVSAIATPIIDIYAPRTDLGDLQFVAGDTTNQFTLCSNMLYSTANELTLPGTDIAILCQEASFETDNSFFTLTLTDTAFTQYLLSAGKWYGCMCVSNTSGTTHETILDGLVYTSGDVVAATGRPVISVGKDIRNVPAGTTIPRFADSLHFVYAFSDAMLNGISDTSTASGSSTLSFITEALNWLTTLIPASSQDIDLQDLRMRAQDAYQQANNPAYGSYVPLLTATDYQPQVDAILGYVDTVNQQIRDYQQQLAERKQEELVIDVATALNDNIIQSGQLLSGYIQTTVAQQQDLDGYYATLITQKQGELTALEKTIDDLQTSLTAQQSDVHTAVEGYKQALKDWETREAIKFALGIATSVFDIATSFAVPAGELQAVASLGEAVQKIQKVLNVLNNVYKAYSAADATMRGILNAQASMDAAAGLSFNINSDQQFDEMNANLGEILATAPSDPAVVPATAALQKAFAILLIRGKALISAQSGAKQLAADLYNQQRLQQLSDRQQARLTALSNSLKPENLPSLDPSTIDLAGLTGNLVYVRSRVLSVLASTFILQDQGLQYQYLQPATPIGSFDLLNFKASIVKQAAANISAKNKLNAVQPSVTQLIPIQVQVPANDLLNGRTFTFTIQADNTAFYEYVDARVLSVDLALDGVSKTDSGKYTVTLEYAGSPFNDRDMNRQPLVFRTQPRQRTYEYLAGTNQPNYTDGGNTWSEDVNPITPFSAWHISLPAGGFNSGIVFKDATVTITLNFVLKARIVQAPVQSHSPALTNGAAIPTSLAMTNAPSLDGLVAAMQGRSALNGWDVVFNFALDRIQGVINKQYDDLKANTHYGGVIQVTTSTKETSHVTIWHKFNLSYSYPKLSFFTTDSTRVQLTINITSGSVTNGSQYDSNPIEWDAEVDVDANAYITANVPIGQVAGIVKGQSNNTLSVLINMSTGTFTTNNISVMNDSDKAVFNAALSDYFVNNPVQFIINTLDLGQTGVIPDLQPNQFAFKALVTPNNANHILQLFIMTGNRAKLDYSQTFLNNIPEPVTINTDCSLMISSKVFFNAVLPAALNRANWQVAGVDPGDANKAWSGKYVQGVISGSADLSKMNYVQSSRYLNNWSRDTYTFSIPPNNMVYIPVAGMTLLPTGNTVKIELHQVSTQTYVENDYIEGNDKDPINETTQHSADFTLDIAADMPIAVSGTGAAQSIALNVENISSGISGHLSGGGDCGCGDDLAAQFNQQLAAQMPAQVKAQLNVPFNDVSVFALKNLLFTDGSMISMSDVRLPGDLLLTGMISGV